LSEAKYVIMIVDYDTDDDVFEFYQGCNNNKTRGLKQQIEAFYRLAGKEVQIKIIEKKNNETNPNT